MTKVAAIQLASGTNINANLLATEKMLEEAARQGAKLAVLPESFAFLGNSCKDVLPFRETQGDGPLQQFLSRVAARLGIWIVGGTIPLEGDDQSKWRHRHPHHRARHLGTELLRTRELIGDRRVPQGGVFCGHPRVKGE